MHNFGRLCYGFTPAIEIAGVGTSLLNNELSHGNGQALMWSGNDHTIDANVIHNVPTPDNAYVIQIHQFAPDSASICGICIGRRRCAWRHS